MKRLVLAGAALAIMTSVAFGGAEELNGVLAQMGKQHNEMWAHGNTAYRIEACVKNFGPINCDDDGFVDPERMGKTMTKAWTDLQDLLRQSQQR